MTSEEAVASIEKEIQLHKAMGCNGCVFCSALKLACSSWHKQNELIQEMRESIRLDIARIMDQDEIIKKQGEALEFIANHPDDSLSRQKAREALRHDEAGG